VALSKAEKLRFIEFLGLLAGLLGIAVSVSPSPFDLDFMKSLPFKQAFVITLIIFIIFSIWTYGRILSSKEVNPPYTLQSVIYYFSIILAWLFTAVILQAVSVATTLSYTEGGLLFATLGFIFNVIFLLVITNAVKGINE
jgi:hypothetical protein